MVQMVIDEAISEALEADNLALQNMASSKYVQANAVFADKVAIWQRKLGVVDIVLSTWADLQKKWQSLESIFSGSADIREQLPADSERFNAANVNYQATLQLM